MHIDIGNLDAMNVLELDEVRHRARLSARQVCQMGGINPSTYQRWMRHARGAPGGSCPHPRTLQSLRDAIRQAIERGVSTAA